MDLINFYLRAELSQIVAVAEKIGVTDLIKIDGETVNSYDDYLAVEVNKSEEELKDIAIKLANDTEMWNTLPNKAYIVGSKGDMIWWKKSEIIERLKINGGQLKIS